PRHRRDPRSFPTRRSSDLLMPPVVLGKYCPSKMHISLVSADSPKVSGPPVLLTKVQSNWKVCPALTCSVGWNCLNGDEAQLSVSDRKSTRLNSSHLVISYA